MDDMNSEILKLSPVFTDYLWGGDKLKTEFNKKTDISPLAESWELSAHPDGQSTVCGGEYDGYTLKEYIEKTGDAVLGQNAKRFDYFPILIKFIDAKDNLSVQVHPDDRYALENEGEYGKTEMWYILGCEDGAFLYYGFKEDITKDEYKSAIKNGTLTDLLNKVCVKKGDVFFIPAGTVHAIGAGIMICEIQQNSNTTYRVYDYNRVDKNGNTRPLHIEKALKVSSIKKAPDITKETSGDDVLLAECEYFTVRKVNVQTSTVIDMDGKSFHSVIVINGQGYIDGVSVCKGDSLFIPATKGGYTINGGCEVIISHI